MIRVDMNLLFNIINIIVLFLLLRRFLIKPVLNVMNKRDELIKSGLENAKNAENQANIMKNEYEKKLSHAQEQSAQIISEAKKEAEQRADNILSEANAKADSIITTAQKDAQAAKTKALDEAKQHIADLAVEISKKVTAASQSPSSDSDIYDSFVKEGDIHGR